MTLRNVTPDNSVRYVPNSQQTKEIKQSSIRNISVPMNQTKNLKITTNFFKM